MQNFSASPREMIASFWRNRSLIYALSKREVLGRYRGSYFGVLWSFINPLFMLTIYTFVFGFIFKARWNEQSDSKIEFALVLFAGLIAFNFFSECIIQAPTLILNNSNYVKKVLFPLEILPWVSVASAIFHVAISLMVWLIAYIGTVGKPQITICYLPLIMIPLALIVAGISWVISGLGVYLRDIAQIVSIFLSALMFLSPIFYRISSLPEKYQFAMLFNPLTIPVEEIQNSLFWGVMFNYQHLFLYWCVSLLICFAGFALFQKMRRGFADVI